MTASANVQECFLINFFKKYLVALLRFEENRSRFKHVSMNRQFKSVDLRGFKLNELQATYDSFRPY